MTFGLASRRVQWVVLLAGLMLSPLVARAQTEAQKAEAKDHYAKATRLYEVGKYGEAIEEYQKVYLLVGKRSLRERPATFWEKHATSIVDDEVLAAISGLKGDLVEKK